MNRETKLREQLRELAERYRVEAAPIVAELVSMESMKPRVLPILCGACLKPITVDPMTGTRCECSSKGPRYVR